VLESEDHPARRTIKSGQLHCAAAGCLYNTPALLSPAQGQLCLCGGRMVTSPGQVATSRSGHTSPENSPTEETTLLGGASARLANSS